MENDELKNNKKEKLLESDLEEELNYNNVNSHYNKKKQMYNYDPYLESGFFSKMFFLWAFKILKLGFKTELNNEDLGSVSNENDSQYYYKKINYVWEDLKYKDIKSNALLKTLIKVNLKYIIIVFILCLLDGFNEYIEIILLKSYIDWFEKNYTFFNIQNLKLLGFLFLFFKFNSILVYLHYMMKQEAIGIWSSYQLDTFVYHKLLKVSPSSFIQRATHGEIVNFTQVDSEKLLWMIEGCPQLIVGPFKIISFIYLLFKYFGLSFLSGFVILIFMFIINIYIYKGYMIIEEEMLEKKDDRMKITTETFDNIKLLKMYNWENEFKNKILNNIIYILIKHKINMSYKEYSKEELNKIKEMFNFLDKNKVGAISIRDVKLGITGLGGELSGKEISELKNQKDLFDFDDFTSICKQKRIDIDELESKLLLAFSLLEVDKKGFVPSSTIATLLKNDRVPDKEIQQLIYEAKPDNNNNIDYRRFVKEMLEANSDDESSNANKMNYNDSYDSNDNFNNNQKQNNNNNINNNMNYNNQNDYNNNYNEQNEYNNNQNDYNNNYNDQKEYNNNQNEYNDNNNDNEYNNNNEYNNQNEDNNQNEYNNNNNYNENDNVNDNEDENDNYNEDENDNGNNSDF